MAAVTPIDPPLPTTFEELVREVRAVRKLLDAHVAGEIVERRNAENRHGALLDLLGDLIARLPDSNPQGGAA